MGHKAGAKALMQAAGVPCIPGYQGEDQGEERLAREAARIGFPVMIKATAGGGGRGMRLVPSAEEFAPLLRSARSEAQSAFGDPEVILERAIAQPRHIEIQVFGDSHGDCRLPRSSVTARCSVGIRRCWRKRRRPAVDGRTPRRAHGRRGGVGREGGRLPGRGDRSSSCSTEQDGRFYFMEMNTRLQVEHPVTEAVTGLDLVELQLRVAAGEPLPLAQQDVRFEGHAIEVRLCAEDAAQGFVPQSGTLALWRMPPRLRAEHALYSGAEVPP